MKQVATLFAVALLAAATGDALAQDRERRYSDGQRHDGTRSWDRNRDRSGTWDRDRHRDGDRRWEGHRGDRHWDGHRGDRHWDGHRHRHWSFGFSGGYWPSYSYAYPRYYSYPRYYYPSYYYSAPVYVAPPPVFYSHVEPVYVERYVEAPPPPPRAEPRAEPRPQASIPPPRERLERRTLSARELFEFDRAELKSPQPDLDEIAEVLNRNPQIANVRITGYTDRIGTDAYNNRLSEKRAAAVKDYLVRKGVAPNRLSAVGRGEANPVVQCDQKDQAALIRCLEPNRRVEIEEFTVEKRVPEAPRQRG